MSDSLLQAAEAEERKLLEELASVPAFVKLQAVKSLIAAYGQKPQGKIVQVYATLRSSVGRGTSPVAHSKEDSRAATLMAATLKFLQQRKRRATTREIMEALKAEGIPFDGDNAVNALASTLSRSTQLNNVRGLGFGLIEWENTDGPSEGSTLNVPTQLRIDESVNREATTASSEEMMK